MIAGLSVTATNVLILLGIAAVIVVGAARWNKNG